MELSRSGPTALAGLAGIARGDSQSLYHGGFDAGFNATVAGEGGAFRR